MSSPLDANGVAAWPPGLMVFLDGRNEHGTHVLPSLPVNLPLDAIATLIDSDTAETIFTAAEALGLKAGDHAWTEWAWNAPEYGEYGQIASAGWWEFKIVRRTPASSQTAVEPVAELVERLETDVEYLSARISATLHTIATDISAAASTLTAQAAALVAAEKERGEAWGDLSKVAGAIGSVRFMDPPDGGDVTLAEQVARMREALEAAESEVATLKGRVAELEAGLAFYASKANYADVPLQQWFRENEGKDAPTGYRCGNIDISAKPGHAIAPIFADLGDLARRLTHQEKNNGR